MALIDTQVHTLTALDGWRLEWILSDDLIITAYDAQGVQQWCWQGGIDYTRLERERETFLSEHGPEQLRLF